MNLYQNRISMYDILSGASIAFAAMLLILPGFFTDTIGFLLLIPITRRIIFSLIIKKKNNRVNNDKTIEAEVIDDKDEL